MDWGLAKVLPRDGRGGPGGSRRRQTRPWSPRRGATGIATCRRPAASWARRPTWPRSRPAARSTAVDRRADVFALGSILCEILTGEPAFTADRRDEILRRAARGDTAEALLRLTAAGPTPSCWPWPATAWPPSRGPARPTPASSPARMTAHLAGVQERLARPSWRGPPNGAGRGGAGDGRGSRGAGASREAGRGG